ncbi:DUF305 domain-containing protein [Aeromicrobium sp.]|uniref:DUF305 domain-containing protein n=1 Tax=Aeromicrobium sp. TaxID=1871063 RepID=UPI002FCC60F0
MKRILMFIAVLPLLALAACGGSTDHNDADVEFAQQMIPHHQQAVMMADLVPGADASPEVVDLAAQIKAAQAPEITLMRGWLKDWDESVMGGHDMGDMDGMEMDGMLSGAEMRELARTRGAEFDRLWLTGMISHHDGAIEMADDVLEDGKSTDVAELARNIITAQKAEIATMEELLK